MSAVGLALRLFMSLMIDKICIGHQSACSDFAVFTLTMREGRCRRRSAWHIFAAEPSNLNACAPLLDEDCADVARLMPDAATSRGHSLRKSMVPSRVFQRRQLVAGKARGAIAINPRCEADPPCP
jgi:hypothetical protein